MNFTDYAKYNRKGYQAFKVEENFYRVIDKLGEPDGKNLLVSVTIRLKNKVNGIPTDWIIANSASNAFEFKISRKFWGRKSKYMKLPYISAIESSKGWDKEHIHALVVLKDLKQHYEPTEIEKEVRKIALSLEEVNSNTPDSVITASMPYYEDKNKELGNRIEYICKSSSKQYNPLARKV